MSYLVCDKCGGYYELQEGESPKNPQNLGFWNPENCKIGDLTVFEGFENLIVEK